GRILNNLYDGDDPDEGLYVGLGTESLPFGKTYTRKLWLQNPTVVGNSDRIRLLVQDNDTKETHTMNVSDIVVPESLWSRVSGSTNNIYSLNSENIGIGTTNPLYRLDVKSADPIVARFFNDANPNGIGFLLVEDELSSGYNAPIGSLGIDGDGSLRLKYKLDSQFSGERAWGKILYANIYGNVSIGADSAKALLHINSKASSTHPFFISNNPGSGIDTTMVFSSAGRLGIGIGLTNPSATIQGQSSTGPATSLLLSTYPAQTGTLSQTLAQSDLRHINAQTCYARNTLIWNQLTSHYEYKQTVANTGGTLNYLYIDITTGASRMATGFTSLDFQNSGNTSFSGAGDFAIGTNVFSGHYPLQITMDAANHGSVSPIGITSYNGSQTITTLSAGGTKAAPTALADMFTMAGIGSRGWDGSAWSTNRAGLNITTDGAWTTTSHGTQTIFKHTAPGSTANPTERLRITSVGVGVLTTETPTAALDVNSDRIRLRTAKTPATAASTGYTGDICWDASYIYVCIATNTWKRSAISTW
ncbi:MAG: hypothetical protein NTW16_07040, partial [Bacteroidetes bacterium]|nr:hypothetical protein [Bacteroidota bacterium]